VSVARFVLFCALVWAPAQAEGQGLSAALADSLLAPTDWRALLFNATPDQVAARWAAETRAIVAERRAARWHIMHNGQQATDTAGVGQLAQGDSTLGIAFRGRFEMKLDQLKNDRCTASDIGNPFSGCVGGFPTPLVDQQFDLRAGGVVSQRIHMNVDYNSEREFNANNDVHVWYQGEQNDVVQRVEIGNVSLDAPPSRFITAAIPANSFGIQAQARFGALEVRSILAQQRGSALRTRVYTIGQQVTQPVDFELRDVDYEGGRFFFVADPRTIPGYPDLDVLDLANAALAPSERPASVRVYRLRAQGAGISANPNLGGINAVALRNDSPQRVGPLPWELLVEGRDYYLDPSGAWFALATRVGTEDYLAVSYITALGDTVGTFPAASSPSRAVDTLELIYEPRRGPEVPTFAYEMRNVYRLGGPDVTRTSIQLSVLLNQSERPLGGGATYLETLGLSLANDPSTVDQYNRVFPRERDPNGGSPIRDLFVVFPRLLPFADPVHLTPAEANDSLYRTPDYLLQSQGPAPKFRLRVHYESVGAGDRSGINLGAIQIREGSERLFIGDRQLIRGEDYEIFYDIGQVTFLHPDELFTTPGAQVRAQFEENQLFDVAPKNIAGLAGTYQLGSHGRIDAIGLYQQEQSTFTRPQLGFEAQSDLIGGLSTQLAFTPSGLTRALDALPLIHTTAPSSFTLSGELAVSRPNANQAGQAYVEEFEGSSGSRAISLNEQSFQFGSAPASSRGLPAADLGASGGFDPSDAVPLVWQNGVSIANQPIEFQPRDIDSSIVLTGTAQQIERVLWLSLEPDSVGGVPDPTTGAPRWTRPHTSGPRWRSITQALDRSGLGVDLSTAEYLEFWVLEDDRRSAAAAGTTLLLDFGTVFEDAVAPAPDSFRVAGADTVFSGLQFVGTGRLDTERDTLTNTWNAAVNDGGILGDRPDSIYSVAAGTWLHDLPLCQGALATGLPIFPLGDLAARCSRHNGLIDTEDLDGDNRLDVTVGRTAEDVVRYVFPLGDTQYYVRDGGSTMDANGRRLTWRLYRIPFRQDSLVIGNPDVRHVRDLRLTVVAPDQGSQEQVVSFALARMQLVGAPWLKRAATPIAGLGGALAEPHGEVTASTVSTDNKDLGYSPPPGVVDEAGQVGAAFQFTSQQINEHALRLMARDLRVGERAEAFTRFGAQGDRNFLKYRQLRVWAQGRGTGWDEGDLEFLVKVGTDEHNFYLFKTRLTAGTWLPELVIDLQRWIALRGMLEDRWLSGEAPSGAAQCGGDSTAFVACDGPYVVQIRDPDVAPPNLASVSEVAVAIYRAEANSAADPVEVWVDDIRLAQVVNDPGVASTIEAHLVAADVADISAGLTRRDDHFRQLDEDPTYVTALATHINSTVRLDKLLPGSWGLALPLRITHERTSADPFYLGKSDVTASALSGLRRPVSASTTYQIDLRRPARGGGLLPSLLLSPLAVSGFMQNGKATDELSQASTHDRRLRADYNYLPAAVDVRAVPQFLLDFVNSLPAWISQSAFAEALRHARLRVNPYQVRMSSSLVDDDTRRSAFRVPVNLTSDSLIRSQASIVHLWTNQAALELRPFQTLSLRADLSSIRDLQHYGDSTTVGRLLNGDHGRFLGHDAGFERQRTLATAANIAPVVSGWLKPRFAWASGFTLIRDPNQRMPVVVAGDSIAPFTSANFSRREFGMGLELAHLVGGGALASWLSGVLPADVSFARERRSAFDRLDMAPSAGYQLGLGQMSAFRQRLGTLAATATETTTLTASGGLRLPAGLALRAAYRNTDGTTWVRQGNAQAPLTQHSREWPSGSVNWTLRPGGILGRAIVSFLGQTQYRVSTTSIEQGLADSTARLGLLAGSEMRTTLLAPSLTVAWRGGIATGAQYTQTLTDITASGSTTRNDRQDWGANLSFSFRAPRSLVRLEGPVHARIAGTTSDTRVCLIQAGRTDCVSVADSRRDQLDVRLGTGLSTTVVGGASFSYILTDQTQLSSRITQYVFTIFAEINFVTGRPQ
jgi:hypothetical protein